MRAYFLLIFVVVFCLFPDGQFGQSKFRNRFKSSKKNYTKLILNRAQFRYGSQNYKDWTNWTTCLPIRCIKTRYRECKDSSWTEKLKPYQLTTKCPVKLIVESMPCNDTDECSQKTTNETVSVNSLPTVCGIRPKNIQLKIFGGKTATPNSWPWHAGIYLVKKNKPTYICGGTLLNNGWVITAAHCLSSVFDEEKIPIGQIVDTRKYGISKTFKVILGDHDRAEIREKKQVSIISHLVIHPEFRPDLTANLFDAALLKLDTPATKEKGVDFACLPTNNYTFDLSTKCVAVGWGYTGEIKPFDFWSYQLDSMSKWTSGKKNKFRKTKLQEVDINLLNFDKCKKAYRFYNVEENAQICAGGKSKGTCSGDSGGGLFCEEPETGRWHLYGISTYGMVQGCGKKYSLFTKATVLADWIKATIKQQV